MNLSPKHTLWCRNARQWIDKRGINRNIGWVARIRNGTLVKVARVCTQHPLTYLE